MVPGAQIRLVRIVRSNPFCEHCCKSGNDDEAQKEILSESIPEIVVDWLIENDALHRFYELSRDLSHAG